MSAMRAVVADDAASIRLPGYVVLPEEAAALLWETIVRRSDRLGSVRGQREGDLPVEQRRRLSMLRGALDALERARDDVARCSPTSRVGGPDVGDSSSCSSDSLLVVLSELAGETGLAIETLRALVRSGRIAGGRKIGTTWVVTRAAVEAWKDGGSGGNEGE